MDDVGHLFEELSGFVQQLQNISGMQRLWWKKKKTVLKKTKLFSFKKSHILDLPLLECTEESVHIRNRERKWQPGPGVRLRHGDKVVAVFFFYPGIIRRVHQLGDQVCRTEKRQRYIFHNTVTSGLLSAWLEYDSWTLLRATQRKQLTSTRFHTKLENRSII